MKIGFVSLGCSKNLVDSERIMGMLRQGGHEFVVDPKEAQAILINTCGFINPAKEEGINTILEMAEYKKGQCEKLIVLGCLAQRYKQDLINEMPEIDRVISISEYPKLNEILSEVLEIEPLVSYGKSERLVSSKPWTAYLKIAEGCSNNCTYCAIPLIRGGNVSFAMEDIVAEAKQLAANGVKELVLIAQDTTKYGLDRYGRLSLLELLQQLHEIEGFHWIRILYMYPDEITDELLVGMTKLPKVLPYFDIPMQHGNDKMLKLMNRRGSVDEALKLVKRIRELFPNPTLRTTNIIGFPHEGEAEFNGLLDFTKAVRWDRMGAFTYSPEEDTVAYDMNETVDEAVKEARLAQLMAVQEEISLANNQRHIGEVMEVLVEAQDGLVGKYRGRGKNSAPDEIDGWVIFKSDRVIEFGSFVQVKITEALAHDLIGEEVHA